MEIFQYGLQRTGTNYIKALLLKNFEGVIFKNGEIRALPTHKHFRLYTPKQYIPEPKYNNTLTFNSFEEFNNSIKTESGMKNALFLITVKDPFSWYLSITKMAKSLGWESYDPEATFQSHYIHDFNFFYTKWKSFEKEAPQRVMLLKYEDILREPNIVLAKIESHFALKRKSNLRNLILGKKGKYFSVNRVPNSHNWSKDKKQYYLNSAYLLALNQQEKEGIAEILDKQLMIELGYDLNAALTSN